MALSPLNSGWGNKFVTPPAILTRRVSSMVSTSANLSKDDSRILDLVT